MCMVFLHLSPDNYIECKKQHAPTKKNSSILTHAVRITLGLPHACLLIMYITWIFLEKGAGKVKNDKIQSFPSGVIV